MSSERETPKGFLIEAAEHFERQITAEDKEYWANVYNAKNYRRCAAHIDTLESTVSAQAAEIERLREALERIAAFDDDYANRHLANTGSYLCFDEPSSVQIARTALQGEKNDG